MVPVIGFCGASGSGKTTLLAQVAAELAGRGLALGVIKHHGHPEPLAEPDAHKDTERLLAAGAKRAMLVHAGGLILKAGAAAGADPVALAQEMMPKMDLVLVEGFKTADMDKIEVFAKGTEPMLPTGGKLLALASPDGGAERDGLTVFDSNDPFALADFVQAYINARPAQQAGSTVQIVVDGQTLEIKSFVGDIIGNAVRGMVGNLKGGENAAKIEVRLG